VNGHAASYREYQGLLGQVHSDLKRLSSDLVQARTEWAASGRNYSPPLERIVLYIDDLDRCSPHRVVEALEAVHLMLTLELFVVVVAVDARWLIRSLEYHHHELFSTEVLHGRTDRPATPVDYLDKIFQIPYVLLPPAPHATAAYLRALMPQPALTAPSSPAAPGVKSDRIAPQAASAAERDPSAVAAAKGLPHHRAQERTTEVERRVTAPDSPTVPAIELQPPGLQLSRSEVEFMTRLGGLVQTPRAAKRLVNIYRLVRIGIPDDDLAGFVGNEEGGPYQVVQMLLAILVGHPDAARIIFQKLAEAPGDCDLRTVVQQAGAEHEEARSFATIAAEIDSIRKGGTISLGAAECQRWCSALARFSFHTRDLARRQQIP
jgi:KAP family P-loop domain